MQALNFADYSCKHLEGFYGIPPAASPFPAASPLPTFTVLTPPTTGRSKKGRARSKRTKPKADEQNDNLALALQTPPESPEDCLDKNGCGDNFEMMSDVEEDLEDEEMQDYRWVCACNVLYHCISNCINRFTTNCC